VYNEGEQARRSDKWREELAQRLEVDLTTLNSLSHGFAAGALRRPANRSQAHSGRGGGVAIAVLAVVLGLAAVSVLGLRALGRNRRTRVLRDEAMCDF